MARDDYRFSHALRVRWAEVDRQGVVFNGHYLTYFDVGVTEYWRAIGYPYPDVLVKHGTDLYAVKAAVEFRASALYDDVLDVCMRVARLGRTSMHFAPEIHRGGELIATGELVYVNVDPATKRPAPLPEPLRAAILTFERVAPATAPEERA
jgi:acyl-CoA thioester hydrolase